MFIIQPDHIYFPLWEPPLCNRLGLPILGCHRLSPYTPLHVSTSPISSICCLCLGCPNALVNISVVWSASLQLPIVTISPLTRSLIQCHHILICFALLWNWGFFAIAIASLLLLFIRVGCICLNPNSSYRLLTRSSEPTGFTPCLW